MKVTDESQAVEPEDLNARVLESTGRLVARHPELLDSVVAGILVPIIEISREIHRQTGFGVPLGNLMDKGLPVMLYRAATDDYKELAKHMASVSVFSKRIARCMEMSEDEIETIFQGALLHDLGKVDRLNREYAEFPGPITQDQKDVLGWHPELGARIAENFGINPNVVAIIRDHHKRSDGNGYAIQEDSNVEIPPSIVQLADALDVMARGRPGKNAKKLSEIIVEVERSQGKHFHPEVAEAFLRDPEAILRRSA